MKTILMIILMLTLAGAMLFLSSCGCDDDDDDSGDDDAVDDDDDDDDDDDTVAFWEEDFQTMAPGDLPAPWTFMENNADVAVVQITDKAPPMVLKISDPSSVAGDGGWAKISMMGYAEFASTFRIAYDMVMDLPDIIAFGGYQDPGPAWEFLVNVEGSVLWAYGGPGYNYNNCAAINATVWNRITVEVDPVLYTYSVFLNGSSTSCVDLQFIFSDGSLSGFQWLGYTSGGRAGRALFNNMAAFTPLD